VGYELHITRASRWAEAEEHPITPAEWGSFAQAHPKLVQSGSITWKDIGTHPVYSLIREDGDEALLSWREDVINVWGITEAFWTDLVSLAAQLHARLVGDEDEEYLPDGTEVAWDESRAPITL
jgi:hypothetical protein